MHDPVQEVSPGAVFGLNDPHVRIEADLSSQTCLGLGFRRRHRFHRRSEGTIDRMFILEGRLRSRSINVCRVVQAIYLDENRASFLGATSANRREYTFDVAASEIGRHPYCRFESHVRGFSRNDGLCITQNANSRSPIPVIGAIGTVFAIIPVSAPSPWQSHGAGGA